jgi:hypothetical protein
MLTVKPMKIKVDHASWVDWNVHYEVLSDHKRDVVGKRFSRRYHGLGWSYEG